MTLRDNILFGHKLDEHLYLEVIDACALTQDIAKVYIYGSYSYKYQVLLYEYFTNITITHIYYTCPTTNLCISASGG